MGDELIWAGGFMVSNTPGARHLHMAATHEELQAQRLKKLPAQSSERGCGVLGLGWRSKPFSQVLSSKPRTETLIPSGELSGRRIRTAESSSTFVSHDSTYILC